MEQAYTKGLILRQRYVNDLNLISSAYNSSQVVTVPLCAK